MSTCPLINTTSRDIGYLDAPSSIAAASVRQRGEEDADVAIRAPPSPPGDAHCRVGFLFVGNGSRPAAARDAGAGAPDLGGGGEF